MTKLQVYAQRCPIMGKAMAIQTSKYGAAAGIRALSTSSKAKIHTSANKEARAVDGHVFDQQQQQHDRGELFPNKLCEAEDLYQVSKMPFC